MGDAVIVGGRNGREVAARDQQLHLGARGRLSFPSDVDSYRRASGVGEESAVAKEQG